MTDLLRRQYDEMVSENARLTARIAAVTAERDALREAGDELYQHVGEWRPGMTGTNVQTAQWKSARQQWRAARAALAAASEGE